jgi:hypothetical protein
MNRIFPRNLTAQAAIEIAGNPVTTRLESGVGNCFPGLEFDHRNLDRRFFPGLVFEFVSTPNREAALRQGARLVRLDQDDPDLLPGTFQGRQADAPDPKTQRRLADDLNGDAGKALGHGVWFLESITQGDKEIVLRQNAQGTPPLDGMTIWRLVRSLEPGPLTIQMAQRPEVAGGPPGSSTEITLSGWRRAYTDSISGTISAAYAAGELTQSLCSPWMHDFRDCACFYWASNHPDIVLGEDLPGEPVLPDAESKNPDRANTPIDWLRFDRSRLGTKPAEPTDDENRPAQMDHYQINEHWQDLSIVLTGKEISNIFEPRPIEMKTPFATPDLLAAKLVELGTLEHVLALEYLYARYSVLNPKRAKTKELQDDVTFVYHELLLIAVSEMRHLRWVNQLLWELDHLKLTSKRFGPTLDIAPKVPAQNDRMRKRKLRTLTKDVLDDFIAVEEPSGSLDGQYAAVVSTLRDKTKYPEELAQLALRIIADGTQHFSRFREIRVVLKPYFDKKSAAYLVNLTPAGASRAKKALDSYTGIVTNLGDAYAKGDAEDFHLISDARQLMFNLDREAELLAGDNLGVPFFT